MINDNFKHFYWNPNNYSVIRYPMYLSKTTPPFEFRNGNFKRDKRPWVDQRSYREQLESAEIRLAAMMVMVFFFFMICLAAQMPSPKQTGKPAKDSEKSIN